MVKIAVIGAGIIGLGSAVKIQEKYKGIQVTLISQEFTPNTTGDGSGGLWYPYLCGRTPHQLLEKWGGATYRFFHDLWIKGGYDVCMVPFYEFASKEEDLIRPNWKSMVFGFQELNGKQLEYFSKLHSTDYVIGQTFITFIVTAVSMLSYLQRRFLDGGGVTKRAFISNLQDELLNEYDVIVNCTGIGARFLVNDDKMTPKRGQVAKVIAPWVTSCVIDLTGGNYIIPNVETCVLGGTHQESYWTEVDPKDIDFIINGCKLLDPGMKHAKVVSHWAGIRPGRDTIRLESEVTDGKLYIHNYGHGGSGMTLFWGCADEVLNLLETHLNKNHNVKSKL